MQDHYDVKMPCHLLLAKLAAAAPGPVLTSLDRLVGPLEKTLTTRLRGEPVKQEVSLGPGSSTILFAVSVIQSLLQSPGNVYLSCHSGMHSVL